MEDKKYEIKTRSWDVFIINSGINRVAWNLVSNRERMKQSSMMSRWKKISFAVAVFLAYNANSLKKGSRIESFIGIPFA